VASCKYLEILLDSDLKWIEHIKYTHNKLITFVGIFYKISTLFPKSRQISTKTNYQRLEGICKLCKSDICADVLS